MTFTANVDGLDSALVAYDSVFTLKFQNEAILNGCIMEKHGTKGTTFHVPLFDRLEMSETGFAAQDISISQYTPEDKYITTANFNLKTVISGGYETLFNFDVISAHAQEAAKASARYFDYVKIEALFASADLDSIYEVEKTVGPVTGLSQAKWSAARQYLSNNAVSANGGDLYAWVPSRTMNSFIQDPDVKSILTNVMRPLADRSVPVYQNVEVREVSEAGINSIPFTTASSIDTYLIPMVHKETMLQTVNRAPKTTITWVPNQDRWEILTTLTTGAGLLQPKGIVLIEADAQSQAN